MVERTARRHRHLRSRSRPWVSARVACCRMQSGRRRLAQPRSKARRAVEGGQLQRAQARARGRGRPSRRPERMRHGAMRRARSRRRLGALHAAPAAAPMRVKQGGAERQAWGAYCSVTVRVKELG